MVYLAKTAGDGKVFDVVAGQEYQHVPLGIGIAKSDTALRDALQKALGTLMENGTYLAILKKYGVESGALSTPAINGGHDLKM
jgi:polar amino acid transport system substrate-binding protein